VFVCSFNQSVPPELERTGILVDDLHRIVTFVGSEEAFVAEQHLSLLLFGTVYADPHGIGLASFALAALAGLVLRFILCREAWVLDARLGVFDGLQGEAVFYPVPKVVDVLQFCPHLQPQTGKAYAV